MIGIRARWAVVGTATLLLVGGCASVTGGQGSASSVSAARSSSRPDFPSGVSTPAVTPTPAPSSVVATSSSAAPITGSQREEVLVTISGGDEVSALVAVPGGFEAASFDQRGHIRFWFDATASLRWQRIGSSRYPYVTQLGPPQARARAALLRAMRHATFIVSGVFSGDGSGNAVAFTTGARGWGAIKAEPNGNIGPSGRPVGSDLIGLAYGFAFDHGYLMTYDCSLQRPISDCDTHPIVKRWSWTGSDFRRVG